MSEALRSGDVADAVRRHRLIAVLRRVEPRSTLLALVEELADAGIRVFEITLDAPEGADDLVSVRALLASRQGEPSIVGAGTILTSTQLEAAVAAGADFGVAPVLDPQLLHAARASGLPFVPGAMTPTEIRTAWEAGAAFVKLFPASAVGPAMVRELRGPLPDVELIPTGGIDATNAAAYLAAGAVAVGIGSSLTRADAAGRRALIDAVREAPR